MRKLYLVGTLLLCNFFIAQAQLLKQFPETHDEFFEKLFWYIGQSNPTLASDLEQEMTVCVPLKMEAKKEEKLYKTANKALANRFKNKKISSNFQYGFDSKKFTSDQIDLIVKICNQMLVNRLKPVPHFDAYVIALLSFINTNQSDESFTAWSNALIKLLETNRHFFVSFIDNCNDIFTYNAIYVNPGVKWLRNSNHFYFSYDSLPVVIFEEKMNLTCHSRGDSSVIYDTKGRYYPTSNIWYGEGGYVFWDRVKKDSSETYAELSTYQIEMKSPFFKADSVRYKNKKYFDQIVLGQLEEKVMADQTPEKAIYPKFFSYSERIRLKNIVDSVDYEGGFIIQGAKFIGKGSLDNPSKLIFRKLNRDFLVSEATSYSIEDNQITTSYASVKMYLDSDSIFHPSVKLKFLIDKRELTLLKEDKGIGAAPYQNTYHKMDMDVEWVRWIIDQNFMEMSTIIGTGTGEINLESANFYSPERFRKLQGIDEVHPLYRLKKFVLEVNDSSIYFTDKAYAKYLIMEQSAAQLYLIRLATRGFVQYNAKTGLVRVEEKVFNYLEAKSKTRDYDNISVQSIIKDQPNITMNLVNFDITVRGVKGVWLSQARKTGFEPTNSQFTLHKNRDMSFSGVMRSGDYRFYGKKFNFFYDDFKVDLHEVDSARFWAEDPRLKRDEKTKGFDLVGSVIKNIRGDLMIDYPLNKSGLATDSFPQYPILTTTEDAFVKYDKRNKQGDDVYDPNKVYFRLDPFTVDSLTYFSRAGVRFPGTFNSEGIFETFDETLVLMPDHSLGFVKKTPPEGMPVFGGKGVFKNDIMLSNSGLMGDGDFEYITSTTSSRAMVFYLDGLKAMADIYVVEPQLGAVEYTDVNAENVHVRYFLEEDYMNIKTTSSPINMYENVTKLEGELDYGPTGMTGSGVTDFEKGELTSKLFHFDNFKFNADTSDFRLKSDDLGDVAFATNNVNATIDFKLRKGDFISNSGSSEVKFPVNQYMCLMDQMTWYMDKQELEMSTKGDPDAEGDDGAGGDDLKLQGSEFTSTHPDQDSLRFISPKANYDLRKNIITAHEVKYINVADARVYTDDGEVIIRKDAKMDPLENCKIVANTTTKYHTITGSKVNVLARRNYTAEGDYQYVDAEGKEQKVHFSNIRVDKVFQTIASGNIPEEDKFMLNGHFAFKGEASIEANKLGMKFNGGTRLIHNCDKEKLAWIGFEAEIDPANVMIPISDNITAIGGSTVLTVGIALKMDDRTIYGNFLTPRKFHADHQIISASGFLSYDFEDKKYKVSNKDKLNAFALPGNYVELNTETCEINAEGAIDLSDKLGQLKMNTHGLISHNPKNDSTKLDIAIGLNFFIHDNMWKNMQGRIVGNPLLKEANYVRPVFERAVMNMVGKEMGQKLVSDLGMFGQFKKIPEELVNNIFISELHLHWDNRKKAFVNSNDFAIASMEKKQVNKSIEGHFYMERSRQSDELSMYIPIGDSTWYYFSYNKGVMRCLSSEEEFNNIIITLKDDDREKKGGRKEDPYAFLLGSDEARKKFLRTMQD